MIQLFDYYSIFSSLEFDAEIFYDGQSRIVNEIFLNLSHKLTIL